MIDEARFEEPHDFEETLMSSIDKPKVSFKRFQLTGAHYAVIEVDGVETQTRYREDLNDVRLDVEVALEMKRLEKKFLTRR